MNTQDSPLSDEGIKVRLSVSVWEPKVADKSGAAQVAATRDADARQHSHHLTLAPKEYTAELRTLEAEARKDFHKLVSAPWLDYIPEKGAKPSLKGCWYFLRTVFLSDYLDKMSVLNQRFTLAREAFIDRYPDLLVAASSSSSGGLGKDFANYRHRYPSHDEIGSRISMTTYEDPIPTTFLPELVDERVRHRMEELAARKFAQYENGIAGVIQSVKQDLVDSVGVLERQCSKKNTSSSSPIHASVVQTVIDSLETSILKSPRHDAELAEAVELGDSIKADLDVDLLKGNEHSRNKVIAGANRIKDLIQL